MLGTRTPRAQKAHEWGTRPGLKPLDSMGIIQGFEAPLLPPKGKNSSFSATVQAFGFV